MAWSNPESKIHCVVRAGQNEVLNNKEHKSEQVLLSNQKILTATAANLK
jgi:hypothetical protein